MAQSCQSGAVEPGMGVDRRSGVRMLPASGQAYRSSSLVVTRSRFLLPRIPPSWESAPRCKDQSPLQGPVAGIWCAFGLGPGA